MSVVSAPAPIASLVCLPEAEGDESLERLIPLVYQELKRVAHRQLLREEPGQTLRTTDLVHEAYLRLVDQAKVTKRGRAYFFAAAARAMRQVVIDRARRRRAAKRGGGECDLDL